MRNIKIIEVRSEIGAGTRGASLGIDAIRLADSDDENLKGIDAQQIAVGQRIIA